MCDLTFGFHELGFREFVRRFLCFGDLVCAPFVFWCFTLCCSCFVLCSCVFGNHPCVLVVHGALFAGMLRACKVRCIATSFCVLLLLFSCMPQGKALSDDSRTAIVRLWEAEGNASRVAEILKVSTLSILSLN